MVHNAAAHARASAGVVYLRRKSSSGVSWTVHQRNGPTTLSVSIVRSGRWNLLIKASYLALGSEMTPGSKVLPFLAFSCTLQSNSARVLVGSRSWPALHKTGAVGEGGPFRGGRREGALGKSAAIERRAVW